MVAAVLLLRKHVVHRSMAWHGGRHIHETLRFCYCTSLLRRLMRWVWRKMQYCVPVSPTAAGAGMLRNQPCSSSSRVHMARRCNPIHQAVILHFVFPAFSEKERETLKPRRPQIDHLFSIQNIVSNNNHSLFSCRFL